MLFCNNNVLKPLAFLIAMAIPYTHGNEAPILFDEIYHKQASQLVNVLPSFSEDSAYKLIVHSEMAKNLIRDQYGKEEIKKIIDTTKDVRMLQTIKKDWGTFLQATNFENTDTADNTHYNAIWVRDSIWGYLALKKENNPLSKKILLSIWDYFSTQPQQVRFDRIIATPTVIKSKNAQMEVPHIRFDGNSPGFEDVRENGEIQNWNHKQNDALGLFLDNVLNEISEGEFTQADWLKNNRLEAIIKIIEYFDKTEFYNMADSGAWEENERINTSSVGLVTSALENLSHLAQNKKNSNVILFFKDFHKLSNKININISEQKINKLIEKGYERINKQLNLGGESPDYDKSDERYRTGDAALLNLIYPAKLKLLSVKQKKQILEIVGKLTRDYGIIRYEGDNYQSANFWQNEIKTDVADNSHKKRKENFIPSTEAQWFFDSWYSTAALQLYKETNDKYYLGLATKYLNRTLAQITGEHMISADGTTTPSNSLPESYNFIYREGKYIAAPSPIIPLNWAKSSMTIMLNDFYQNL